MSVTQEESIHQIGNEKNIFKFEDCLTWQELTSDMKDCPKMCLPVNFHALFGQKNDQPKCQDPNEYKCMLLPSAVKLVRRIS